MEKNSKNAIHGIVHVSTRKNNTHVTVSNFKGDTVVKFSAGLLGLKGRRRGSALAGQRLGERAAREAKALGYHNLQLRLKGFGRRRNSVHRGLMQGGITIRSLVHKNTLPHNGCRPAKKRRI